MKSSRPVKRAYLLVSALAIASIVFIGFARNYYLRAWIGTRPISLLAHVHGLVMTAWIVLFLIQAFLIRRQYVHLHRWLGIFGALLSLSVFVMGILVINGSIQRQLAAVSVHDFLELFVAFDGLFLLLFLGLVLTALLMRGQAQIHRRLMLLAMVCLMPPAFGRLIAYFSHDYVELATATWMILTVVLGLLVDGMRHAPRLRPPMVGAALILLVDSVTYYAQMAVA
jgi:hypothetical protein